MKGARPRLREIVWLAGILAALATGYAHYHQLSVGASSFRFVQETILVFLGTVATIFLTAISTKHNGL
jgi:hypothetical protein